MVVGGGGKKKNNNMRKYICLLQVSHVVQYKAL
jgi:hypothetical protein